MVQRSTEVLRLRSRPSVAHSAQDDTSWKSERNFWVTPLDPTAGRSVFEIRALRPDDAPAAREMASAFLDETPCRPGALAALNAALEGERDEFCALVATRADDIIGVIVFGRVAGATGAGKLHLIVVTAGARLTGVARHLIDAASAALSDAGCRFVISEVPSDPTLAPALGLLGRCGFMQESRVPDFYRDGVDQVLLRRQLQPDHDPSRILNLRSAS
jgi:ribosomal protein S18 acetylase RimI-like enzyme